MQARLAAGAGLRGDACLLFAAGFAFEGFLRQLLFYDVPDSVFDQNVEFLNDVLEGLFEAQGHFIVESLLELPNRIICGHTLVLKQLRSVRFQIAQVVLTHLYKF